VPGKCQKGEKRSRKKGEGEKKSEPRDDRNQRKEKEKGGKPGKGAPNGDRNWIHSGRGGGRKKRLGERKKNKREKRRKEKERDANVVPAVEEGGERKRLGKKRGEKKGEHEIALEVFEIRTSGEGRGSIMKRKEGESGVGFPIPSSPEMGGGRKEKKSGKSAGGQGEWELWGGTLQHANLFFLFLYLLPFLVSRGE